MVRSYINIQETIPPRLRSAPHSIVIADDFYGPDFQSAFRGVSTVFHHGANLHPQEWFLAIAIIDMAKEAGAKHFVLCSVFQSIRIKIHVHKVKLSIEEYLVESRLNYTILQPTSFMQNVTVSQVMQTGIISLGFSSSVVTGFIDLFDLATVARSIILSPTRHFLAQYELVGQNASYDDVSRTAARVCRRDIQCNVLSREEFIGRMKITGELQGEYAEEAIERLIMYSSRWRVGLAGNANVLRWLLGREPTTWEGYIRRELSKLGAGSV
ncbi:NAD(P)-binding protein [Gautieria morchelliformis]|nr:NAD(P)-binding protein [Gautieria morchelliformis]